MKVRLLRWLVLGGSLCACSQTPAPSDTTGSSRSLFALEAKPMDAGVQLSALTMQVGANTTADPEDCDKVRDELAAARRALARTQSDLAQLPGEVSLQIRFTLRGRPFELEQPYNLTIGEIRFRALRYWLSQLTLLSDDGVNFDVPDSYYLMEARGTQQLRGGTQAAITLPAKRREIIDLTRVRSHTYTKLAFNVGVDAAHNDDLSKSAGELNVMQNMASIQWMWFTSYIFTQLDAVQAGDMDTILEDGGAPLDMPVVWETGTNQDLRRVELALPSGAQVGYAQPTLIDVELDVAALFEGLGEQLAAARSEYPSSPFSSISAADAAARSTLSDNWGRAFRPVRVAYGSR